MPILKSHGKYNDLARAAMQNAAARSEKKRESIKKNAGKAKKSGKHSDLAKQAMRRHASKNMSKAEKPYLKKKKVTSNYGKKPYLKKTTQSVGI